METNSTQPPAQPTQMPGSTPVLPPAQKNSAGPIIGTVIIVLILALGGAYFWYDMHATNPVETMPEGQSAQAETGSDSVLNSLTNISSKDTASAIEADLSSTDTGNASGELQLR